MAVLVLSVGRDATLLAIRNLILSSAGYHVVAAATPEEFVERFYGGDFDAVVLCHSLPDDQRKRITELVHAHSPSTPVVVMANGDFNHKKGLATDDALVFGDTRDLVRVLPEVLRSNHRRAM
jgi:DNA-binding response OmpR family regulator